MDNSTQRTLLWTGVLGSTVFFFGFGYLMGFFPPPSPSLNAAQVVELYTRNLTQFRLGVMVSIAAGGFFLPLTVVISVQMARHEKGRPVLAILQGLAGTGGTMLFFLPVIFWGVAAFSVERDPALTLLMHELAFIALVTPTSMFFFQALALAMLCFKPKDDPHAPFPRWLGYLTIWALLTAETALAAFHFKTGPFAWNGLFPFWLALAVFSSWLGTLVVLILRDLKRQEA